MGQCCKFYADFLKLSYSVEASASASCSYEWVLLIIICSSCLPLNTFWQQLPRPGNVNKRPSQLLFPPLSSSSLISHLSKQRVDLQRPKTEKENMQRLKVCHRFLFSPFLRGIKKFLKPFIQNLSIPEECVPVFFQQCFFSAGLFLNTRIAGKYTAYNNDINNPILAAWFQLCAT